MAVNNIPKKKLKFRVRVVMTVVFFLLFLVVAINFFHISVTQNEKYQDMANDQHFGSILISAHRGSIYDSKGSTLAKSASVYKV
ncbi:MAG: peptidoglycan glycosyltransferase, partial [Ruminococcus sp.]|nr:peptidoglycan glycosyltransferase [Ruminococcus sp.]